MFSYFEKYQVDKEDRVYLSILMNSTILRMPCTVLAPRPRLPDWPNVCVQGIYT